MKKAVTSLSKEFAEEEKSVKKVLIKLDKILGLSDKYIEVYLVGDAFMKKNVLSFAAPQNFPHPETQKFQPLGEIYLNPQYIKENGEDLTYMLVHGLLHLLGYDHQGKSDRIKMTTEEQKIMQQLTQ